MKKVLLVLLILVIATTGVFADKLNSRGATSLGLNLGTDVGVSVRYGYNDFDIVGNVGLDILTLKGITAEAAASYHVYTLEVDKADFPVTAGVGAALGLTFDPAALDFSVLFPLGIEYTFEDLPITAFLRFAPGVAIISGGQIQPGFDARAYIGALWNFEKKGLFN